MKKSVFTGIAGLFLLNAVFGQNETDALRYSRTSFGGTARFSSMGGAFGAIGGDISTLSFNPAGLGLYRKNELVFTPSVFTQNVSSEYNGTITTDSRYNLRFNNIGFVFAGKTENTNEKGWQYVGMGIAYNRLSSFQSNVTMSGQSSTSLMDSWAKTAGGTGPYNLSAFNEGMGWNTYMLNTVPGDSLHYTDTIPEGDMLLQRKTITTRGGMGEWLFAIGANYSNRVYIGASISVPQVRYSETSRYTEEELVDSTSAFNSFQIDQGLETKGKGFNFKCGVIFRPTDYLRVGLAFHSPTVLRLNDVYYSQMVSSFTGTNGQETHSSISPTGTYDYKIRTPMRVIASAAFIIGKIGMISGDLEIVDYSEAKLSAQDYLFIDANNSIKDKYTMAQNFRVGGEIRKLPFILRGGFAWYGSPYQESVNNNAARMYFTGGLGYRDESDQFYIDFAIISSNEKSNYYFYDQSLVNPVHNTWKSLDAVLTVGFRY